MNRFLSWVRWHGPFRSRDSFRIAIDEFEKTSDRARLYVAVGRLKRYSIKRSQVIYLGMNGLDSTQSLGERSELSLFKGRSQTIRGLLNEYWFGEIHSRFDPRETDKEGIIHDTEKALIYATDPLMNKNHSRVCPFSFRLFNEFCVHARWLPFKSRLQELLPQYVDYDQNKDEIAMGTFRCRVRKTRAVEGRKRMSDSDRNRERDDCLRQRLHEGADVYDCRIDGK